MKAPKPKTAGAYIRGVCKTVQVAYSYHLQESRQNYRQANFSLERNQVQGQKILGRDSEIVNQAAKRPPDNSGNGAGGNGGNT
ncbi:hypothetical protein [Pseudomonas folii]|uniref:Uncharacterized protein n=1 Tax=Pseudomonas folii TaxID=2762593 RepID=A0ABR7AVZ3_9PSED|nr:hypothetical protein [Pseudomonas folii]MBC3949097.1 hypothetical protein [Pseudomonas folii]